jgi:hypothetical protein
MRIRIEGARVSHFRATMCALVVFLFVSVTAAVLAQVPTSDLTLWIDASSITGLSDGNPVATWSNKSPNLALHLSQGTAASQPTYKTGILNGLPVVRFDGINDVLTSGAMTNFIGSQASEYTMFSVFDARLINTDVTPIYNNDAIISDSSGFAGQYLKGLTANAYNWDGNADSIGTPIQTNTWYVLRSGLGSGSLFVHANNQPLQSTASGANTLNVATHTLRLGARSAFLDGDIAEVLIYKRALTLEERNQVAGYLADKYAISIPEPSALALWVLAGLMLWHRRSAS